MKQNTDNNEIWKVWKDTRNPNGRGRGLGSLWEVSNLGNVKKNGKGYIPKLGDNGYLYVGHFLLHRIIAEVFIPNQENKPCVDHIDTNPLNNKVENLRWVTCTENCNNRLTKKHMSDSTRNSKTKMENISNLGKRNKSGENNSMYGKNHKEESKKLMSLHHSGGHKVGEFKQIEESKQKNREAHLGKPVWNKGMSKEEQEYYKSLSLEDRKIYRLNKCKNNI